MIYLTVDELIEIHDEIVRQTGGLTGVANQHLLESAIHRPKTHLFGLERHSSVFSKAASLLDSIANHHVFTDGNKRTAMAAASRLLALNGFELRITDEEYEDFMLEVVNTKPKINIIAAWLKNRSEKY